MATLFSLPERILHKVSRLINISVVTRTDPKYCDHGFNIQSQYFSTSTILKKVSHFEPDAILIMFMQNFLSFENILEIQRVKNAPVYIYMMDMAPLTGGCHYAWDCVGYKFECGRCPALYSNSVSDRSAVNFQYKKEIVGKGDFVVIAASSWQKNQLADSSLFKFSRKGFILSPTDDTLFRPIDKKLARCFFEIDENKKIIFIGSINNQSLRKGGSEALVILKLLASNFSFEERRNIQVLVAGSESPVNFNSGFDTIFLGKLSYESLVLAYNASTLFLNTSIEDSGPTMINQAVMCGIPVVSFNMGVAPDLVINGQTGFVAELKNYEDMALGISKILNLKIAEYEQFGQNCRSLAIAKCGLDSVAKSFLNLHGYARKA